MLGMYVIIYIYIPLFSPFLSSQLTSQIHTHTHIPYKTGESIVKYKKINYLSASFPYLHKNGVLTLRASVNADGSIQYPINSIKSRPTKTFYLPSQLMKSMLTDVIKAYNVSICLYY